LSRRAKSPIAFFLSGLRANEKIRVSKSNTIQRTFCTLGLLLLFANTAAAQSVLNFAGITRDARQQGIAIINPNTYYADVQLTLYGLDGNPVGGLMNPINQRIAPKSQLQMLASELFIAGTAEGWVQATSVSSGLTGFYFAGDFNSALDASEASTPMLMQVLPLIREDQTNHTEIVIINPGSTAANASLTLYGARGAEIGTTVQFIPPHGAVRYRPASGFPIAGSPGVSARITSTVAVTAMAVIAGTGDSVFVNGQPVDQIATTRIVPNFVSGNGIDPQVILSNPNSTQATVTVTLFAQDGGRIHPSKTGPSSQTVTIPSHGSLSLDTRTIADLPAVPPVNGWLQIDSGNIALNGVVVLDSGAFLAAVPFQRSAADRMSFAQLTDTRDLYTELDLVNPASTPVSVEVMLLYTDGSLLVDQKINIAARSKLQGQFRDLIPEAAGQRDGFVFIRASAPLYGVEMLGGKNLRFLATIPPQRVNLDFVPNTFNRPVIADVEPSTAVAVGNSLQLTVTGGTSDMEVLLGNLSLTPRFLSPTPTSPVVDIPAIEPGYANLRVRIHGVESDPVSIHILSGDSSLTSVTGLAFYQKTPVTDLGLELNHPTMTPVRSVRVEVIDAVTQALISVSETDARGQFTVDVPQAPVVIRALSRLRDTELKVVDNLNNKAIYSISIPFDIRETDRPMLADRSRVSGAFNILEMIQRSNELVHIADNSLIMPAPTIYWSTGNTKAIIGTTYFNLASNTAYILGDRNVDSDEFDDSVIIHEYGHMVAARFSRDDSPGGPHGIGELQDPRLAWSEGWANFFSAAVRNDAIYRDSRGPNGSSVYRIDVEDRQPANDQPGMMSEATIHSLLWDLLDEKQDGGTGVQYSFGEIWAAITDLKADRFVYVPYFLEHFVTRHPADADAIRNLAVIRSIDFQPNVRPSVSNPWPRPLTIGEPIMGYVDSLTTHREHLAMSAHFFSFTLTSDQLVSIRSDILGLGPGGDPNFNDIDLFLEDINGHMLNISDGGGNGGSNLIARPLPKGTYVIELRTYYRRADDNTEIFNSGDYRLRVITQ